MSACFICFICNSVKPTVIEMPRVRILNVPYDTPDRMFPVATALQLTCEGQVGSDSSQVSISTLEKSLLMS